MPLLWPTSRPDAPGLIVSKIDRLSRSLTRLRRDHGAAPTYEGWALIDLTLGVDTITPAGKMVANLLAVFAEYERDLIAQRTAMRWRCAGTRA